MNRDFIVIILGTLKLAFIISLTLGLTNKKGKQSEIAIPIVGAFVFMWVSWIVTYISQLHPFVEPEFIKE